MRLFLAVDLGDDLRSRIGSLIDDLEREVGDVRWVRSAAIHLTLKFLGEVAESRVSSIRSAATATAAAARGGCRVAVRGMGTFGDRRAPRVVWLGVEDPSGRLADLAGRVEEACAALGFPREGRAFQPHLTLARLKSSLPGLAAAIASRSGLDLGGFDVTSFHLFQSLLRPEGATYLRLSEFRLGAEGAATP